AYSCVSATFAATHAGASLALRNARHPLLERKLKSSNRPVVPVSVELEGERREMIITGPNTGGKTVALKTVGLLVLMAQSGIPVPADRAELSVFDAVLADIGDYQSIEQNLSTFSAHVTNIDFISRTATPRSLVLLDELGSATDPEEGAAVAFDESTLQPTYELRVGVPGASAGINIAQRLGLNPQMIEAARSRLSTQTQ